MRKIDNNTELIILRDSVWNLMKTSPSSFSFENKKGIYFNNGTFLSHPAQVANDFKYQEVWGKPLFKAVMEFCEGLNTFDYYVTNLNSEDLAIFNDNAFKNPIQDTSIYNWEAVSFQGTTKANKNTQVNFIKISYALGRLTDSNVISLGAVRK